MMRCPEVDSLLPGWALEELSPAERSGVGLHLETCSSCQEALSEIQGALGLLAAVPPLEPSPTLLTKTTAVIEAERAGPRTWAERWDRLSHRISNLSVTPVRGVLATAFGFVLFFTLMDVTMVPASAPGAAALCDRNTRRIGKAVTEYQSDHQNELPESLKELVPEYLNALPYCPAARKDTYSEGYEPSLDASEFEVFCQGHNHASEDLDVDSPRFVSTHPRPKMDLDRERSQTD